VRLVLVALAPILLGLAPLAARGDILPNGTYKYQASIGGKPVGGSTIVVTRDAGNIEVDENGEMLGQVLASRRRLVAATFETQSYATDVGGKHFVIGISGPDATLTQGGQSATISTGAGAPFLVNDNMTAGFATIPATLHVTGAKQLTLACLCGSYLAVPASVTSEVAARPAGVSA
jgi:hypothetical protein